MLTDNDIDALYARDQINHATWCNAHRALRGESDSHLGELAIKTCEQLHAVAVRFASDAANKAAKETPPLTQQENLNASGVERYRVEYRFTLSYCASRGVGSWQTYNRTDSMEQAKHMRRDAQHWGNQQVEALSFVERCETQIIDTHIGAGAVCL